MSAPLRDLQDISLADRPLVGGKAASLGELMKLGANVPAGFVVTTEAFSGAISEQLATEVLDCFSKLGAERVAVRSSAVSEDAPTASWAGQLETYLNVTRDGLLKAIAKCWRSADSEHAKVYANLNNITQSGRTLAVVVQVMVEADIAGVLFTANPITNDTSQCVVEAVYGLGELLVQGIVTPETYVINKQTGKVIEFTPHRQQTMLIYKNGQNMRTPLLKNQAITNILSHKQRNELNQQARLIEKHYGQPQDIEWVYSNSLLFIVQSRPVTTLPQAQ